MRLMLDSNAVGRVIGHHKFLLSFREDAPWEYPQAGWRVLGKPGNGWRT